MHTAGLHTDTCMYCWLCAFLFQGTLRSALDRGMFKPRTAHFKEPKVAALLARDVAAAMLHLHRYVCGDLGLALKMLTFTACCHCKQRAGVTHDIAGCAAKVVWCCEWFAGATAIRLLGYTGEAVTPLVSANHAHIPCPALSQPLTSTCCLDTTSNHTTSYVFFLCAPQ
jgi:hypothetical protein